MKVFTVMLAGGVGSGFSILEEQRARSVMQSVVKYGIIVLGLYDCSKFGCWYMSVLSQ